MYLSGNFCGIRLPSTFVYGLLSGIFCIVPFDNHKAGNPGACILDLSTVICDVGP